MTTISVPVEPVSFPGSETENKKGAWSATEWEGDVYVMMTKLEGDQAWDETNSAMYSSETYYYNNREGKEDTAGRVPVDPGTSWRVLMLNYHEEEEQSIKLVYGAAVHSMLAYTGLALSLIFTAFAF